MQENISVNPLVLTIMVIATLDWFGAFTKVERLFAKGVWVTTTVEASECLYRDEDGINSEFCDIVNFNALRSGEQLDLKCVRDCRKQLNLLVNHEKYRIMVAKYPFIKGRILYVEHYNDL